jgi:hypothetical protein
MITLGLFGGGFKPQARLGLAIGDGPTAALAQLKISKVVQYRMDMFKSAGAEWRTACVSSSEK